MTPEEIKAARKELGMTQRELAYELGVDVGTLRRWELGQAKPSPYLGLALEQIKAGDLV